MKKSKIPGITLYRDFSQQIYSGVRENVKLNMGAALYVTLHNIWREVHNEINVSSHYSIQLGRTSPLTRQNINQQIKKQLYGKK